LKRRAASRDRPREGPSGAVGPSPMQSSWRLEDAICRGLSRSRHNARSCHAV
jgi:hypothetical protein